MKTLRLSLLAVTLMFLVPHLAKAERFETIPAAITDTETGLMWLSQPCCIHGSWEQSETFTAGLHYAGYQDWRTPTIEELAILFESIWNLASFPTQTYHPLFDDLQRYYWTTDPYMVFDVLDSTVFYDDVNPYWIWPVRTAFIPTNTDQPIASRDYSVYGKMGRDSGLVEGSNRSPIGPPQRKPSGKGCTCAGILHDTRWCDNENGTVTDMTTCIVWLKNANWTGGEIGTWEWAKEKANNLEAGTPGADLSDASKLGHWRLPKRNEFIKFTRGRGEINYRNPGPFKGIAPYWYWTGSRWKWSHAWVIHLDTGRYKRTSLFQRYLVWPVKQKKAQ